MMLIKSAFIIVAATFFVTLMQGCAGASSAITEQNLSDQLIDQPSYSEQNIDSFNFTSGNYVISQSVSASDEFEIPTDTTEGENPNDEGESADGGSTPTEPTPAEPTPTPTPTPEPGPVVTVPDENFCKPEILQKYAKKGYKGNKIVFVNSNEFKFENHNGKYIVASTDHYTKVKSIKNFGGKLTLCGLHVDMIQNTNGRLILAHTLIEVMDRHKGNLELDEYSRVRSISQTQCSVHKK